MVSVRTIIIFVFFSGSGVDIPRIDSASSYASSSLPTSHASPGASLRPVPASPAGSLLPVPATPATPADALAPGRFVVFALSPKICLVHVQVLSRGEAMTYCWVAFFFLKPLKNPSGSVIEASAAATPWAKNRNLYGPWQWVFCCGRSAADVLLVNQT